MENARTLAILRRQAWLVILITVIVAGLAAYYSSTLPKEYDATATIRIGATDTSLNSRLPGQTFSALDLADEADQVGALPVANCVATSAGRVLQELRSQISLRATVGSLQNTIRVTVTSLKSKSDAASMANAYADCFKEVRSESKLARPQKDLAAARSKQSDLNKQRDSLRTRKRQLTPPVLPNGPAAALYQLNLGEIDADLDTVGDELKQVESDIEDYQDYIDTIKEEVTIKERATGPGPPARPKPVRNIGVGIIAGLLLGFGIAFLRDSMNDKLGTKEQIEQEFGLTVLTQIPVDVAAVGHAGHLAMAADSGSMLAESLRTLRSSIQLLGFDSSVRRVVITSSSPGEGKSYVAANLAVAFAQAGFSTTLVSSDLRRPGLDRVFSKIRRQEGLSAAIGGQARLGPNHPDAPDVLAQLAQPTEVPGLDFVPAGPPPPNAGELLASRPAGEVFAYLAAAAEINIYDSPPLLAVRDATILATMSDGVILVAVPGSTRRSQLRQAKASLDAANVKVLGLVLNRVKLQWSGYSAYTYSEDAPSGATVKRKAKAKRKHTFKDRKSD